MLKLRRRMAGAFLSLSIRYKISLSFILAFLVLIITLTALARSLSSDIVIRKTVENASQNLDTITSKFDLVFDGVESYSKIAITNSNIQTLLVKAKTTGRPLSYEDAMQVKLALNNIIVPRTMIAAMIVYDVNGNHYDSDGISVDRVEDYVKAFASSPDKSIWIDTHPNAYRPRTATKNVNVVCYIRKIYSLTDGSQLGLQEVLLDEDYVSGLYSGIKLGTSGGFFLVDGSGKVVSSPDKKKLFGSVAGEPYYSDLLDNPRGREVSAGSERDLLVSRAYPRLGWVIAGLAPLREITSDNDALTLKLALAGTACAALAILISFLLSLSITGPIIRLKTAVKAAGKGNLDVQAKLRSRDEIGDLADEFDRMVQRTKALMQGIYAEQKKKREYELAALQAQINPHFLYNTLESVCGLAYLAKTDDLVAVVKELALFYRGVLSSGDNIIELSDEVKITERYLNILKVRYGDKFGYEMDVEASCLKCPVIKLMLQPLVENAVYHGIKNKHGSGMVSVRGGEEGGRLVLRVHDDGIGMEPEKARSLLSGGEERPAKKSFGVKSTDERIKLYFGPEYGIAIDSVYGEGTTVTITLPMGS